MNRLRPDPLDARFIRRVFFLIVIGALLVAIYRAADLLILAFGSVLGAVVIHALADLYRRRTPLPARFCVPAAMLTVMAVTGGLIWLFAVQFADQVQTLVTSTPGLVQHYSAQLSQNPVGAKFVDAVRAAYAGSKVAQDVGGLAKGSVELLLNIILLIVGALFFAVQPNTYRNGFLRLIPADGRPVFADALDDLGHTLRLWLRAQLILMTTMGVLVGVGLWIAGVPSAAALGFLAGLSEFIPYVGPTVAMLPALGLAAANGSIVGALVVYALVRLLQSNFITPWVQNRVIDIPPAITLFAIIGIGMVFGVFGLFFSAALLVVIFSLIRSLYLNDTLGEPIDEDGGHSSSSKER